MMRSVAISKPGQRKRGDESSVEVARSLAEVSAPAALAHTSRLLVVEPRSTRITQSLRGAGFAGKLVALASVHIGERYGITEGYTKIIVDDWTARITTSFRERVLSGARVPPPTTGSESIESALGTFQSIVVTDLSRFLDVSDVPGALRWLSERLEAQGCLALADPAQALKPERLVESLRDLGLQLASDVSVLDGDWPRTLAIWRRASTDFATPNELEGPITLHALYAQEERTTPGQEDAVPPSAHGASSGGAEGRGAPVISAPKDVFPFRLERMLSRSNHLKVTARAGTKLVVVTAPHGALLPEERTAISRYRLEQYTLANLYSASLVEQWRIREDPSMALLNPEDIHIVTATADGLIASYMCLQTASSALAERAAAMYAHMRESKRADAVDAMPEAGIPEQDLTGSDGAGAQRQKSFPSAVTMSEESRPLFPVETEYGDLFARHPGLKTLPFANVREITRLVRNQNPQARAPLREVADLAVAETIVASAHYVSNPVNLIEAVIGCIAPEARQALLNYRIPVAYAPEAPIAGDNLGGGSAEGPLIWTDESREEGRFWPFAISALDLRRDLDYFMGLDEALNRSSTREAREAVNTLRKRTPLRAPRFAASFTYSGYTEDAEQSGYAQVTLPVAWIGLEARTRSS
jgi:hypothetical protein